MNPFTIGMIHAQKGIRFSPEYQNNKREYARGYIAGEPRELPDKRMKRKYIKNAIITYYGFEYYGR